MFITLPSDTNRSGTSGTRPNSFPMPVLRPRAHASGIEVVTSGIWRQRALPPVPSFDPCPLEQVGKFFCRCHVRTSGYRVPSGSVTGLLLPIIFRSLPRLEARTLPNGKEAIHSHSYGNDI